MPVKFSQFRIHDEELPLIVENAIRAFSGFAGIHDHDFDNLYAIAAQGWDTDQDAALVVITSPGVWDGDDPDNVWDGNSQWV